jgi:hypothetical protein
MQYSLLYDQIMKEFHDKELATLALAMYAVRVSASMSFKPFNESKLLKKQRRLAWGYDDDFRALASEIANNWDTVILNRATNGTHVTLKSLVGE